MTSIAHTIVPKSDQLNADDLLVGPKTIKIIRVEVKSGQDQPVAIYYDGGDGKPYLPCKSMRRAIVRCWGDNSKSYLGKSMTLYCDPSVTWAGEKVGGIRISHMTDIETDVEMSLTASKGKRKAFTVKPLYIEVDTGLREAGEDAVKSGGLDALQSWFKKLNKSDQLTVKPFLDELKAMAEPVEVINDDILGE